MAKISLMAATAMISRAAGAASAQTMPRDDHLVLIIEENHEYSQIIGHTVITNNGPRGRFRFGIWLGLPEPPRRRLNRVQ